MKTKPTYHLLAALIGVVITAEIHAQTSAFTYQGGLIDNGGPASGSYDLRFAIYDVDAGGAPVGGPITNAAVAVTNGSFTTTLDFGSAVFDGGDRWLEISVATNGSGVFTNLSPRQLITSVPYAIKAAGVDAGGVAGTLGSAQIADGSITSVKLATNSVTGSSISDGSITGSEIADGTVGATDLSGIILSNTFWRLDGNSGGGANFLGTVDNQALVFKVNNTQGMRLEYPTAGTVPNLINGYSGNSIGSGTEGAVIAGGGMSAYENLIGIDSDYSTIAGGRYNRIEDDDALSFIAGGFGNKILSGSDGSCIGGGDQNMISSNAPGSFIAGGAFNHADSSGCFIGGELNKIGNQSSLSAIGGGIANGIGSGNYESFIGGGYQNSITNGSPYAALVGGYKNHIANNSSYANLVGGCRNAIGANADYGFIGGGSTNNISANAQYAVIPGGELNTVGSGASYALAAGRRAKANHSGTFVWADATDADFASSGVNQFLIRASGGVGIGETRPLGELHISTVDLGIDSSEVWDEDIIVENGDSGLGLFSNDNGSFGSFISMKEMAAGALVNTWGIIRNTSGGGNNLQFRFGTDPNTALNPVRAEISSSGVVTATSFSSTSDRNQKRDFEPVRADNVLAKVATLPISSWAYKEEPGTRHIGPMAQDFYAAFAVGPDDKHITTVDEGGVALAAIQGLNQKLAEKEAEIADLEARLEKIEALMNHRLNGGAK